MQTDAISLDEELNSFVEEFLRINFKKQRAEAAKYADELKASVRRAEEEAVAVISEANKDVSEALPAKQADDQGVERIAASVENALDDVLSDLQASLEQYQIDYDRTLVEGQHGGAGCDQEHLHAIDVALEERPRQLISHSRKLIKKHDAELKKRADRKETGAAARSLIRQLTAEHKF